MENFDEAAVNAVHQETGFDQFYIEKVLRLLRILETLFAHSALRNKYVLKGGTALNLFYFDLPRLSVDIDLNYLGLDREIMLKERDEHEKILTELLTASGYELKRVPEEHAGGKWRLRYESFAGITQNIELDVNYMHRLPLMPVCRRDSFPLGGFSVKNISVLDIHELAAGKLCALIARCKPRDLFDANRILNDARLDIPTLRRCFTVYAAFNKLDFSDIKGLGELKFTPQQFRQELMETLTVEERNVPPGEYLERLLTSCRESVTAVLPFSDAEQEFLTAVNRRGEIKPQLLSESETWCRLVGSHPMLQWKSLNVRKHYGL